MHVISKDSPCYFLTSVAKDRLPVFRKDEMKGIVCKALDEARKSGKFALYAYVIMPDHLHLITDSARSSEDALRFTNGIISRRLIAHLKEQGYESSLLKLRQETKRRHYQHSLWDHLQMYACCSPKPCCSSACITFMRTPFGPDWWNVQRTTAIQVSVAGMDSRSKMSRW